MDARLLAVARLGSMKLPKPNDRLQLDRDGLDLLVGRPSMITFASASFIE
jgi:hypothetical protein